jgi:hypothetical protein
LSAIARAQLQEESIRSFSLEQFEPFNPLVLRENRPYVVQFSCIYSCFGHSSSRGVAMGMSDLGFNDLAGDRVIAKAI